MSASAGPARRVVLEVHREAGPPRLTVIVRDGRHVADVEVAPDHGSGSIRHEDGWSWRIEHPPGSGEWWLADGDRPVATAARHAPVGERFALELAGGGRFVVVPTGRWWTRRWSVHDDEERVVLEVRQRPLTRPVHDLVLRSGDLPPELPWVVAWVLAERLSRRQATTRRSRWGISTAWGGEGR
ncbi:MAG: hypothetical protein ACLFUG_06885 [Nitriliruptoraceae bacterium]